VVKASSTSEQASGKEGSDSMNHEELITLFSEELFIAELKAKDRDGVLKEMVDHAAEAGVIHDRDVILGMLKNRESLGSTGLGEGIAFPHGRSLAIPTLMAFFAHSKKGVDYGAIDGKPVHLFFMFIAPPVEKENRYLPALGQVVELIRDEPTRDQLLKVKTFDDFRTIILGEN
jgi:mannitol/fructose-specific phosphotransferase system IIA component (Ntr-type)